jgi:hypothetical protein
MESLALYARRDLALRERLRVRWHVARCCDCEQQVLLFESATGELKRQSQAETLTAFEAVADWNRLENEMLGNITVGLAAARCIQKVGRKRAWVWRAAFAGGLAGLFAAGWVTHVPSESTDRLLHALFGARRGLQADASSVVRTKTEGIAVGSNGVELTILHPRTAVVSLSGNTGLTARYIDEDSGQVTVTNVYGQ